MKKLAFLFLMLFTLVQLAPAVKAVFTDTTTVFIIDEEKNPEKQNEQKEKKDFTTRNFNCLAPLKVTGSIFQFDESLTVSPCLEKLTPPPNC